MHITQLRNATIVIQSGALHILVDPMLADQDALPPFKVSGGMRRNPLCPLPGNADAALAQVTHCLITHCQKGHMDHLDRAGTHWLRERQIPVLCSAHDATYLRQRGLNVTHTIISDGTAQPFFDGTIRTVACTHGRGLIGALMEHGVGYMINLPDEPSLYLAGDTILSATVRAAVTEFQPAISVVPAGGARFDLGGEIIMGIDEVLAFAALAQGAVIANHLEALSHCPVTRAQMRAAVQHAGLGARLYVPDDGASLAFSRQSTPAPY